MDRWINFNGEFIKDETPIARAGNRGLRYGEGIFETMKWIGMQINLRHLHFERLFRGIQALKIRLPEHFNEMYLEEEVRKTIIQNSLEGAAKVRVMVFRGDGGLYETSSGANYIVESEALAGTKPLLNEEGLNVGVYASARKSCDEFSSLKTNNFLIYAMAALYAKEHGFDDCLVLNTGKRICDSTISNVFWVKNEVIYTPPLSEGCIGGVMRKHLLHVLPNAGYAVTEQAVTGDELEQADELFLTNAITAIRWVRTFNGNQLKNTITREVFERTF